MSKVIPVGGGESEPENVDVCPRYQNWMKRIKKEDNLTKNKPKDASHYIKMFSTRRSFKRKTTKNEPKDEKPVVGKKSTIPSPSKCSSKYSSASSLKNSESRNHRSFKDTRRKSSESIRRKPLRSRSIFVRIRQKGRNFKIRCKTSVELWRKWIKRGIHWDRHVNKDIDVIPKPDKGLQDFKKKNIINEVIPEEDESEFIDLPSKPSLEVFTPSDAQVKIQLEERSTIEETPTTESRLSKWMNLRKFSTSVDRGKVDDDEPKPPPVRRSQTVDSTTNGIQSKYPMSDLASMNIDHLETVTSGSEQPVAVDGSQSKRNTLRRALNKLRLLF